MSATLSDETDDAYGCTDDYYYLFSDRQRRVAVRAVHDEPDGLSLSALARTIGERLPESEETIETRLHHVHLPMLADAGVVDYDPERNRVELLEPITHFPE